MQESAGTTDYSVLAAGYSSFLFALGGVGITVLTLVLTLKDDVKEAKRYASLVACLVLFALASFAGGHLMSEAISRLPPTARATSAHAPVKNLQQPQAEALKAAAEAQEKLAKTKVVQKFFVIGIPNVYIAAALFLFTLIMLPLTYRRPATLALRKFFLGMGTAVAFVIFSWQMRALLYIGTGSPGTVLLSILLWAVVGVVSYRNSSKGPGVFSLSLVALAIVSTEVLCAFTKDLPAEMGLREIYSMAVATSVGVASIAGMTVSLVRESMDDAEADSPGTDRHNA